MIFFWSVVAVSGVITTTIGASAIRVAPTLPRGSRLAGLRAGIILTLGGMVSLASGLKNLVG